MDNEQTKLPAEGDLLVENVLTLAMNVEKINDMQNAGKNLVNFLSMLRKEVGNITLDLRVTINPYIEAEKERQVGFVNVVGSESIREEDFFEEDE